MSSGRIGIRMLCRWHGMIIENGVGFMATSCDCSTVWSTGPTLAPQGQGASKWCGGTGQGRRWQGHGSSTFNRIQSHVHASPPPLPTGGI